MELEKLKLLGLNTYETKAYITLIKKGKSKASFISQDSGVPNGKIYDTLDSLEHKGLIQIIPEKIKYYIPKPISHLKKLLLKKQKELTNLNKELDKLKEISETRQEGDILVVRGKKNFHKILQELPEPKKFSYTLKWNADITDLNIMKKIKNRINQGVKIKTLYNTKTPSENIKKWSKLIPNYKFIETDGIAMGINEKSVMISILELNSTILITSKNLSKVMKQLYEGYYKNKK